MVQDPILTPERSVEQIERLLEARIRRGEYPVGAQLPTVRELAQELGVNKSTTERAYQGLKRKGYLDLTRGRGAFVRQTEPPAAAASSRWLLKLDHVLAQAKASQLTRGMVLREVYASIERIYGEDQHNVRVAFVECNPLDVRLLADQLSSAVGYPLEAVLLNDLLDKPAEMARRFDLIVTTFFHLGEVSWALPDALRHKVVGVLAKPTHDALLNIARLRASVIGVVVTLAGTIDNLVHIIHTYHPNAMILPAQVDDEPRLRTLLAKADAVVVTRVTHERLLQLEPQIPVVVVSFTIDQQSIDFLRTRIWDEPALPAPERPELELVRVHA